MIWGLEQVEARAIRAFRFVDAETKAALSRAVDLRALKPESLAAQVKVVRNRSGVFVICAVPGLEAWVDTFMPPLPEAPAAHSVELEFEVRDPERRFLPRRFTIAVPPDRALPEELYTPVDVLLYPAPNARSKAASAVLRFSCKDAQNQELAGVLLSVAVEIAEGKVLVEEGVSDQQGEAIVFMAGIPSVHWSESEEGTPFYPSFGGTVRAARLPDEPWPPNPDVLEAHLSSIELAEPIEIASAGEIHREIVLPS